MPPLIQAYFLLSSVNSNSYPGKIWKIPGVPEGEAEVSKGLGDRANGAMALGRQQEEGGSLQGGGEKRVRNV